MYPIKIFNTFAEYLCICMEMKIKQIIVNTSKKLLPFELRIFFRKLNWKRRYIQQLILKKSLPHKVYCPIAKREFKRFIKSGNDLLTPSNGARCRQRMVWHYLENELNIRNARLRLLHIAPEYSFFQVLNKQKNIDYVPGDKMVLGYSNQKGINHIDLTDLKFEDSSFDCILANHVLEHITDDKKAMTEIYRTLKTEGVGVITIPIDENLDKTYEDSSVVSPKDREKHFGQWDHVRIYAPDIKERFEQAGFKVEMNRYLNKFSKEEKEKYGFMDGTIIIVLRK